jgi:hypothetical protein
MNKVYGHNLEIYLGLYYREDLPSATNSKICLRENSMLPKWWLRKA